MRAWWRGGGSSASKVFDVVNGAVEPDMDTIADFSELDDPAESVLEAKVFIEGVEDSALVFEFTLAADD